jgi:hypothetical protein
VRRLSALVALALLVAGAPVRAQAPATLRVGTIVPVTSAADVMAMVAANHTGKA